MNLDVKGKKVLVRVDFNVPLNSDHQVSDDTRIRGALPTINYILDHGGSVVLMSHLGRPQKKLKEDGSIDREQFTLQHVVGRLSELLDREVLFCDEVVGPKARSMAAGLQPGQVLLLENTRFEAGEKKGDRELAKQLASLGDLYVNDAFGSAHRAHVSTTSVAELFAPEQKSFGFLMEKELKNADKVLHHSARPLTAILGGAKVSDKIMLIERLIGMVDNLLIGGGMAYTFFKAQGGQVGKSLVEEDRLELAADLIRKAKANNVDLLLPEDSIIADDFSNEARHRSADSMDIPGGWMGLDIGEKARRAFADVIANSKTIFWNGPMGVFEMENFASGTRAIAKAVADATDEGAYSLVGVNQMGLADEISFVSTGGGAMLEFMEGKELPGVQAIKR